MAVGQASAIFRRPRRLAGLTIALAASGFLAAAPAGAALRPGTPNSAFGSAGVASAGNDVRLSGVAAQPDGKVVVTGRVGNTAGADVVVERFTAAGRLDGSFGSGGIARGPAVPGALDAGSQGRGIAVQSDGKIVVVGKVTSSDGSASDGILIERFNSNGSVDTSFGHGGTMVVFAQQLGDGYGVAVQPDGKIVATGSADGPGSDGIAPRVAVARLNSNGSIDTSFGAGGLSLIDLGPYSVALAVARQSDGKIVIAGSQSPGLQAQNALLARLNTNGSLDGSFATGGAFAKQYAVGAAASQFNAVAIQADGRIVVSGAATSGNLGANLVVARFTTAGGVDGSFGSGGTAQFPASAGAPVSGTIPGGTGVAVAFNGDIVTSETTGNSGQTSAAIVALKSNGALDPSFGNGGAVLSAGGGTNQGEATGLAIDTAGNIEVTGSLKAVTGVYTGVLRSYAGFGTPAPPPPPALSSSLTKVSGSQKISTILRHGLKLTLTCNEGCNVSESLTISASTAKHLGFYTRARKCKKVKGKTKCTTVKAYKTTTIGSASGHVSAAGKLSVTLKISSHYSRTIGKQKSVGTSLSVVVSSRVNKNRKTFSQKLTLKK